MATKSTKTTNASPISPAPVSPLQAVFNAAAKVGEGEVSLVHAVKLAGNDQKPIRDMICAARVALSLNLSQEAAMLVCHKTGNPKHNPVHDDDTRSPTEEKAYGAARGWVSAFFKRNGLFTSEGRGGDRTGSDDGRMETEKLTAPKFRVTNSLELAAFCKAHAEQGYHFFLLNKAHSAVTSELGSALMGLFADHLDNIKTVIGKFEDKSKA